jgi:hypothetical protein
MHSTPTAVLAPKMTPPTSAANSPELALVSTARVGVETRP